MSEPGNKGRIYARIAGTGSYLPEKVLTNDDLAKLVDTSDEWIQSRTGIRERHIAAEGQTAGDLGYQAALRALEAAGVDAAEIDLIIVGTTTPDLIFERFSRGDANRRGFGLGLSLVRDTAERLGGRVLVERTDAAGTTFLLVVPAVPPR